MADFYNTASLSTMDSGSKEDPAVSTYSLSSESGTESSITEQGIKPPFYIGKKKTAYPSFAFSSLSGSLVYSPGTPIIGGNFKIVEETQNGKKYQHPSDQVYFAHLDNGELKPKIYSAVSTKGLDYVPVITDEEEKLIRRWPRDWHGDNMKN